MSTRTIPVLPPDLEGRPVNWDPWQLAPTMSHHDDGCEVCDHEGPLSVALGRAQPRGVYVAIRCRRCQNTKVTTWRADRLIRTRPPEDRDEDGVRRVWPKRLGQWLVVWTAPPQPFGEDL